MNYLRHSMSCRCGLCTPRRRQILRAVMFVLLLVPLLLAGLYVLVSGLVRER
jgi:hypothetical protein